MCVGGTVRAWPTEAECSPVQWLGETQSCSTCSPPLAQGTGTLQVPAGPAEVAAGSVLGGHRHP